MRAKKISSVELLGIPQVQNRLARALAGIKRAFTHGYQTNFHSIGRQELRNSFGSSSRKDFVIGAIAFTLNVANDSAANDFRSSSCNRL